MNISVPSLAPSILAADFTRLADEVRRVEQSGAGVLHLDIMDGHFVPNLTFGPKMVADIRNITGLPLDVHLMIGNPEQSVDAYVDAGASIVTFHAEAVVHTHRLVDRIHSLGAQAGIAIVPSTALSTVEPMLDDIDLLLVMTVNPGFGGQKLIPFCVDKIRHAHALRSERSTRFLIECDGGVNEESANELLSAGTDILVAGSAFFGSADPSVLVSQVQNARLS